MQSYNINHGPTRLLVMTKPAYNAVVRYCPQWRPNAGAANKKRNALVFVSSRKQAKLTAVELLSYANADQVAAQQRLQQQRRPHQQHNLPTLEDVTRPRFLMTDEQNIKPLLEKVDDKVINILYIVYLCR